jgi:hypothetical protein
MRWDEVKFILVMLLFYFVLHKINLHVAVILYELIRVNISVCVFAVYC